MTAVTVNFDKEIGKSLVHLVWSLLSKVLMEIATLEANACVVANRHEL